MRSFYCKLLNTPFHGLQIQHSHDVIGISDNYFTHLEEKSGLVVTSEST